MKFIWSQLQCPNCFDVECECETLDTRPEDRRERARQRWHDLRSRVTLSLWHARRNAVPMSRVNELLTEADRAWSWFLRWDQKVNDG